MKRPSITDAIKKGLDALPLDIEVWLYGSEARGDARPDSDIDLLVLFNKPKVTFEDESQIYNVTTPIEWDCGVAINPMIYPKSQWESRMTPFRMNVLNDGIRIRNTLNYKHSMIWHNSLRNFMDNHKRK